MAQPRFDANGNKWSVWVTYDEDGYPVRDGKLFVNGKPLSDKAEGNFLKFLAIYIAIAAVIAIIVTLSSGNLGKYWDDDKPDHGCRKSFSFSGEENQRYEDCVDRIRY